jgi:hypothetical protein
MNKFEGREVSELCLKCQKYVKGKAYCKGGGKQFKPLPHHFQKDTNIIKRCKMFRGAKDED